MRVESLIGRQNENNSITAIYCRFYGAPNLNGITLRDYYTSDSKVLQLMSLGNLSSLGEEIGSQHNFSHIVPHWCKAYGRDGGNPNQKARVFKSVSAMSSSLPKVDYIYIWTIEGRWRCFTKQLQSVDLYRLKKSYTTIEIG